MFCLVNCFNILYFCLYLIFYCFVLNFFEKKMFVMIEEKYNIDVKVGG